MALLGAVPASASAAQIALTGDVVKDFQAGRRGVGIVTDNPNLVTRASDPGDVAQADWITAQGHVSGWNIQDVRLHYDSTSDTLAVGVNFFGIAGDADGDGDPGRTDPRTAVAGGVDLPGLGGRETISVAFDLDNNNTFDIIAGVPADKSTAGTGLNGFNVARYKGDAAGVAFGFGQTLTDQLGDLAFDPSAARSDFEFTIKNFTKIPGFEFDEGSLGFEFSSGLGVSVLAGTPDDIIAGEDSVPYTRLSPAAIPEPATIVGWAGAGAIAGAWRLLRRRRRSA